MKTSAVPVLIWVLVMIKKDTEKHLEQIPGSPNLSEMQQIAHAGTALILRKTICKKSNKE